jgi:hypothetical protein
MGLKEIGCWGADWCWAGSYDDGNASSGCINNSEPLHQLSGCGLITKDLLQGVWQRCRLNVCLRGDTKYVRSAQIPGTTLPGKLNFYMVVRNILGSTVLNWRNSALLALRSMRC